MQLLARQPKTDIFRWRIIQRGFVRELWKRMISKLNRRSTPLC